MLAELQALQNNIRVGIVGMGSMGKGLLHQCQITPGIRCVVVADVVLERAIACVDHWKLDYEVVQTLGAANLAIERDKIAVCEDGELAARCAVADVLIESTSAISAAGTFATLALTLGKHLVMMNAEADLVFGPYLMHLARESDLVYTSCDGDQHGVLKRLIDEMQLWGIELVMAGNIKGFLDRDSNPTKIIPEADKRRLDYRMATAYTDGTKLCIEMALLANGLDLRTHVPGMFGPRANDVREVFERFDLDALWRDRKPCVDYILGAEPGGGVFAIGFCEERYQQEMLAYYKLGEGPFYLFYRPYHLCHVEAMRCVAEAALDRRALLQPRFGFRTNVFAYAKRPLRVGEELDGIGGYTCYGLIENVVDDALRPGLPICLAEGVRVKRAVGKGEKLHMEGVEYDPRRLDFELYAKAVAAARCPP